MTRAVVKSGLRHSEPFPAAIDQVGAVVAETAFHHLVTIQRNEQAGTDDGGQPLAPDWQPHLADQPCLGYVRPGRAEPGTEIVDALKQAVMNERRVLVALDTDVTVADRLDDVTEKDGTVVFAGPMNITALIRRVSYLELSVQAVS